MHRVVFNRFPGGVSRCLTVSYDDGVPEDIRLIEIFNKNGIKSTFFLNSINLDRDGFMPSEEIKNIYKGHEIACHMMTHPRPTTIPGTSKLVETYEDRKILERTCGYPVRGLSYPFGNYDDETVEVIKSVGIEYARTTVSTRSFDLPKDFLRWHPTCRHREDLAELVEPFLAPGDDLRLFYVWGHSYEFSRSDNWNIIEDFCRRVGGRDDIWYATNIEIVDYVNATKALRISLNLDTFYNPSAMSVWLTVDGQTLEIPAGKTVKI